MRKTKTYWKSLKLKEGKIVSGYDGSEWQIGEWRKVSPPERECEGLNCSEYIADAMGYVNMEVLAQVEIAGKVIKGDDKITCEKMRILHAYRWEKRDSVEMSVYAAELVVENFEKVFPNDTRVRDTINLVNKYLTDPSSVTEDKLWSAAESAWSAEWSAWSAEESAWSAEWSSNVGVMQGSSNVGVMRESSKVGVMRGSSKVEKDSR